MADGTLCYICAPRYVANASINTGKIPICTQCAYDNKIKTDQEAEAERLYLEEQIRKDNAEIEAKQAEIEWAPLEPYSMDDIPF
jgi:hypothetical protein